EGSSRAASLRSRNPIAALEKRGRLVRTSRCQPLLLAARGPQQDRAKRCGREARDEREFLLDFAAQFVNPLTHAAINFLEFLLHHPKRRIVSAAELLHFALESFTNARIGVVLIAPPALEHGLAHAIKTRPIALELTPERPIQESLGILARDSGVPEVEFVLPMDIGEVNVRQQTTLFRHFLVKRRARNRRVEHELVEVGLVVDRRFNFLDHVVARMVFESDDGRALHSNPVFAKLPRKSANVLTL